MNKITQKLVLTVNIILAFVSFFIAISFFTSQHRMGFIVGFLLFLLVGGQFYLQKLPTLKHKIIASLISVIYFLLITEISYRLHI